MSLYRKVNMFEELKQMATPEDVVASRGRDVRYLLEAAKKNCSYRYLRTNIWFYNNQIPSRPAGAKIDYIHQFWKGNYDLLAQQSLGYIEWLFPMCEETDSPFHESLKRLEILEMLTNSAIRARITASYEMMLDYYGMQLVRDGGTAVKKTSIWAARSKHLNDSPYEYRRITRILKFLTHVGERFKKPFVEFMINEAFVTNTLMNCRRSCVDFWIDTLRDAEERKQLRDHIPLDAKIPKERSKQVSKTKSEEANGAKSTPWSFRNDELSTKRVLNELRRQSRKQPWDAKAARRAKRYKYRLDIPTRELVDYEPYKEFL